MQYLLNVSLGAGLGIMVFMNLCRHMKTPNLLLRGYYSALSVTIVVIGATIADVLVEYVFLDTAAVIIWLVLYAVCFPLSRYIGSHLHKTYTQLSSEVKKKFALYGFAISSLICILAVANMFLDDQILLFAVVILVFFIAIIMTGVYSLSQQKQAEAQLKTEAERDLIDHTRQFEIEYNDMRSFRHDYRNLLSALMGYDNIDDLKAHLAQSLAYADEALKNLDSVTSRLSLIEISELKGLLAVKCAHAQALEIDVELDIAEPIRDISLNRLDLCRLAGIVMDNAIEELEGQEKRTLKLAIVAGEGETIIVCANSCKNPPPVNKIFEEGYTTKGRNRGLGLPNLKRICNEHQNVSYTVRFDSTDGSEDGEFAMIIVIARKEEL